MMGVPAKKRAGFHYSLPEKSGELKQAVQSLTQPKTHKIIRVIQLKNNC